ncbi:hypothetical protein HPB51_015917 [Rhipicephalus microplus]|uniref:Protein kinase domain-containing protein n=1 Tax=Rhipicephalus microplus TaxID=6941 RepID=A0A9J6DI08_RHIMP|nr:hypothetical protein HPB51_015917 [Rhipicephalus microplus]
MSAGTPSETSDDRMKNYILMEKIGEGTYGVVYKAKCKATNKIVAIKKIRVEGGGEANVLIDDNGGLKVADFGLCRAFTLPVGTFTHEVATLWYRAPEILLGASRYSTPVDVWSIGCIFFELITGKTLFRGDSEIDQLFRIFRVLGTPTGDTWPAVMQLPNYKPTFPMWRKNIVADLLPEVDCEAVDLLQKMLIYSPGERISAKGAAAHPYLAGSTDFKQAAGTTEKK